MAIDLSIFELLKIGPGPSSSHTIGPMAAGYNFLELAASLPNERIAASTSIQVELRGSLSATGKGHGTDRAAVAGLMGNAPEDCPSEVLDSLAEQPDQAHPVAIKGLSLSIAPADVIFGNTEPGGEYSNVMIISLLDAAGNELLSREYYSVGGGFIQWKGWNPPERGKPVYPYANAADVDVLLDAKGLAIWDMMLANESAITGMDQKSVLEGLDRIIEAMDGAVKAGLDSEGVLPGPIGLYRKASTLYERSCTLNSKPECFFSSLDAYALAASEENAAGHRIVTAPTCGASGVIPGIIHMMRNELNLSHRAIRRGLLAAALVGFLCKSNASIAGADVGCQGEVGTASSMAAALLACAYNGSNYIIQHAASIALEHHLGLTCDPVGGYVQIPCIERNAMGAIKAYNAYIIAMHEVPAYHKVPLDATIRAMAECGRDMNSKYRETSKGGLAVSMVLC